MAGNKFTVTITPSVASVEKKLKELEPKIAKKIVRDSLKAGAKPVLAAAQAKVPVKSGLLRRNIKIRAGKRSRAGQSVVVGFKDGAFKGDAFYGAFIEWGHQAGKGANAKTVPAQPFLRPAIDEQEERAAKIIIDGIWAGISKEFVK